MEERKPAAGEEALAPPPRQGLPWRVARRLEAYGHWALVASKVAIPFLLAAIYMVYILAWTPQGGRLLGLLGAYFFPPLGKESVVPFGILVLRVPPMLMATYVALIDVLVGLFLVWNYPALYRIPFLGRYVRRTESKAHRRLKEGPVLSRLVFMGIVLLVVIPFQGSGAVSATIIGRLAGKGPLVTWVAIILGAFLGTLLVAYSVSPFL